METVISAQRKFPHMRQYLLTLGRAASVALLALGCLSSAAGAGRAFPAGPVTIVLPYSPGSGTDSLARIMAQVITSRYGVPVVIDNKPGANGFIAAQHVAKAAPDGYTLFLTGNTTQSANPHLFKKLPYDPIGDFSPISLLSKGYMAMVVRSDSPARSVADIVSMARQAPGKLNFAAGTASSRIAGEMFKQTARIEVMHVPYKSNPLALIDLMSGRIDFMFVDTSIALEQLRAGKLRVLAVTSARQVDALPGVPTMKEAGIEGYEWAFWLGMYAPAGTPSSVIDRLNQMMRAVSASPEVQDFYKKIAAEPAVGSPDELARFQKEESDRTGQVVQTAGMMPE